MQHTWGARPWGTTMPVDRRRLVPPLMSTLADGYRPVGCCMPGAMEVVPNASNVQRIREAVADPPYVTHAHVLPRRSRHVPSRIRAHIDQVVAPVATMRREKFGYSDTRPTWPEAAI